MTYSARYQPYLWRGIPLGQSDLAFDKAIESGRLSDDETADNYAGDYMFMGSAESVDLFKHRDTRQYLPR